MDAATLAFFDEREAVLETLNDALNLMAYLDDYAKACGDHGLNGIPTLMARGKMFKALHDVRKKNLRRKIILSKEDFEKKKREYIRLLSGKKKGA